MIANQPFQVENISPGPSCPLRSLRRCCWNSTDNFSDPQSSLVTQQQAAWWGPSGGTFGLRDRETRRRLACGGELRENERCYHNNAMYEPSQHQPLFSSLSAAAAAGCRCLPEFTRIEEKPPPEMHPEKRLTTVFHTSSIRHQMSERYETLLCYNYRNRLPFPR